MEIRHTGRNELEILLSPKEAQKALRKGEIFFSSQDLQALGKAILKEEEIQADINEGGYGDGSAVSA